MLKKYSVVNVDAQREEDYQYIGETEQMKTPLYIHKAVLEADYLIAIGNIAPHNVVAGAEAPRLFSQGSVAGSQRRPPICQAALSGSRKYLEM